MKDRGLSVAVVGAATLAGREVQAALQERGFPVRAWRLLDCWDRLADTEAREFPAPLEAFEPEALADTELAFLCAADLLPGTLSPRMLGERMAVIDLTQVTAGDPEVPLVVPEVNAAALAAFRQVGVAACPLSAATALAVALGPLEARFGLKRVVAALYEPVSSAGAAAIEELSSQVRRLLNGEPAEGALFPRRIAFNLIPAVGSVGGAGETTVEAAVAAQVRRVLERPDLPVSVTAVRVPTFFGQGLAVHVETEHPVEAREAEALLREAPGVVVDCNAAEPGPTPADVVGSEATWIGRIRSDGAGALALWVVIDECRKGGAVNAVQIAEILLRDHL